MEVAMPSASQEPPAVLVRSSGYWGDYFEFATSEFPLGDVFSWLEKNGQFLACAELRIPKEAAAAAACKPTRVCQPAEEPPHEIVATPQTTTRTKSIPLLTSLQKEIPTSPDTHLSIYPLDNQTAAFLVVSNCHQNETESVWVVSNCSGYWVADYCRLGGFPQVLFFPLAVSTESILDGAILTDGIDLLSSNRYTVSNLLPKVQVHASFYQGLCFDLVLSTPPIPTNLKKRLFDSLPEQQLDSSTHNKELLLKNACLDWRDPIETALKRRLAQAQHQQKAHHWARQTRDYIQKQSQESLSNFIQQEFDCSDMSPLALTDLRYRVFASNTPVGKTTIGFTLWLEVTLMNSDANHQKIYHNVYLVCTLLLPEDNHSCHCQSGIVPQFESGDEATILVAVHLQGFPLQTPVLTMTVSVRGCTVANQHCGSSLGNFSIPYQFILQAPFHSPWHTWANPTHQKRKQKPTILYDCRRPYTIQVNVSACPNLNVAEYLKNTNQQLCANAVVCVDQTRTQITAVDGVGSVLNLTIFALTKAEVLGIIPLLLSRMPGNATIVEGGQD